MRLSFGSPPEVARAGMSQAVASARLAWRFAHRYCLADPLLTKTLRVGPRPVPRDRSSPRTARFESCVSAPGARSVTITFPHGVFSSKVTPSATMPGIACRRA